MRGGDSYKLRWPVASGGSGQSQSRGAGRRGDDLVSIEGLEFDEGLYEKLRKKRSEIASEEGVPPYVVFNNQTLEFLTRLRPTSVDAGTKIRGVGEKKAQRFLPAFLEVIKAHG
jgi:ATP-dependent DNA helicase RecQ